MTNPPPQSVQKEEWEDRIENLRVADQVAAGVFEELKQFIRTEIDRICASVREETIEKCAVIAWRTGMDLYMKEIDVREVGAKAAHNIRNLSALQELSD